MNPRYRNIFIAIIAIALLLGAWLVLRDDTSETFSDDNSVELQDNEIEVTGTISCLPSAVEIPEEDCIKSVRGDDGKIYALNTIEVNSLERTMPEGTKVRAIGIFEPANTSIDESSGFTYDGVLVVRILQRR